VDRTRRLPCATLATATIAVVLLAVLGPGGRSPSPRPDVVTSDAPAPTAVAAGAAGAGDGAASATTVAGPAAADGPTSRLATPGRRPLSSGLPSEERTSSAARPLREARDATPPVDVPEVVVAETIPTPEGHLLLAGSAEAGSGPTVRFTVEVEPATGIDPAEALEVTESALFDPRSWERDHHLVRISDPAQADIRLLFATPDTVDRLCAAVGLDTNGVYSCWTGTFAAINSWRYAFGATGFDDRDVYRRYVVNHEVGHGLGRGHVGCPGPGELAPIMLQQSASLGDCLANDWPYPD
jgi:hypothetical protein